ncbi:hypothetical protein PIROE2DRAFT_4009, partial [Piromyces sp. E2]
EIFFSGESYNIKSLRSGNILFSNFWDFKIPNYEKSLLPGKKKGINGSCIHGFNIGISKYITNDRILAAVEILKYFTSEEIQKEIIENFNVFSGIGNLYNDYEICSHINCKLAKEIQSIERPVTKYDNYDKYSTKVSKIFYEFIHNGKSAEETVNDIKDITEIYFYSMRSTTFNLWILYIIGSLVMITSEVTKFGELNNFKCQSSRVMMTSGYTMVFIPMLYKLIVIFPQINKYSTWTYNDIRALTVVMSMDGVLLVLFFLIHFASINDYITFYSIHTCIILLFSIINHAYIFIIRIWFESTKKEKSIQDKLENKLFDLNNNNNNNNLMSDILNTNMMDRFENEETSSNDNIKNRSFIYKSKILSIHFATKSDSII